MPPPSIVAGPNELLGFSAVKSGEIPHYPFQTNDLTPGLADFDVMYATVDTNGTLIASERVSVSITSLNFTQLSAAAQIRDLTLGTGIPHVTFRSVSNWVYHLAY